MRSCSAHNDYRGVWKAVERCWRYMTTESVLTHSEKHNWAGTHKTREDDVQKKKKIHNNVTSLDKAAHHKAPECTEKRQNTLSDLYKTKYHLCIRVSLIYFPKRTKWGFVWQQMTCIWVGYAGMILYNFMQRWGTWVEKRQLFLNGCLHWEVWPAWGGCPFSPSSCLVLQLPGLC